VSARGVLPAWETAMVVAAGLGCIVICLLCSYFLSPEVRSRLRSRNQWVWFTARAPVVQVVLTASTAWRARVALAESRKLERLEWRRSESARTGKAQIEKLRSALTQSDGGFLRRARTRLQILKLRRQSRRERDSLQIQIADVRFRFRWRKEALQRIQSRSATALQEIEKGLGLEEAELQRYRSIRFSKYVLRIIGF
jgi:hypothetical protein